VYPPIFIAEKMALEKTFFEILKPPCAIPAPVGAGAHTIPFYYREIQIWV